MSLSDLSALARRRALRLALRAQQTGNGAQWPESFFGV